MVSAQESQQSDWCDRLDNGGPGKDCRCDIGRIFKTMYGIQFICRHSVGGCKSLVSHRSSYFFRHYNGNIVYS